MSGYCTACGASTRVDVRARLRPEDDAGGGGVGVEFSCGVDNLSFRSRGAAADVNHFRFATYLACLGRHRSHIVHLDFECGVARTGGEC